jgi:hypothetical protein
VDWAVNVALALATTGNEPVAIERALGYIEANTTAYLSEPTANTVGRYGWLLVLADATDRDPRAFGADGTDLVTGILGQYEIEEAGLFGPVNTFGSAFNQALSIIGLVAAGEAPPADAVTWLRDQQCDGSTTSVGGWQPYRAPSGGGLEPCVDSDGATFAGADANSTAFAVQALAALGDTTPIPAAVTWLHELQVTTGGAPGGFGQYVGDPADPNSTAVVVQAIVAAGEDPAGSGWAAGGGTPLSSLATWQISSGAEAGALASPYSAGFADLFATYQGVWGLAQVAFPLPASTPTTPSTPTTTPGEGTPTGGPAVAATVTPSFTG